MAVKVTLVPAQMVVWLAAMLTEGVTGAVTVIVTALLVAVGVLRQLALLVSITVTTSLLFNVDDENVTLLVPAFTPFTFHW